MAASVSASNAGPIVSSLKATPAKKKRALAEAMAEIPSLDSIEFNPIDRGTPRRPGFNPAVPRR